MYLKTRENGHRVVMNASTISRAIAVLGKFLPPEEMESLINDLLKLKTTQVNWDFPLSETLEAFNEKLLELIGGQGTLNYSETALVIQNSTNVFERRVEALHSDTCRMREVLNEHEQENEAAKTSKPRQKSHQNKLDLDKIERVDFLKDVTKNCFLKTKKPLKKPKLLSQRYPQLENMCRHKFSLDVIDTQGEKIGKKYDFRCNQQLTSSHMLVDELSPEDFQKSPPTSQSPELHLDPTLIPSCSTPCPTSSRRSSILHHHISEENPQISSHFTPNFTPRPSTSSPTPSQINLEPQYTSDFDTDDFFDSQDSNPLNQTQESGYCTLTDCSTTGSTNLTQSSIETAISSTQNDSIHEESYSKVPSSDSLGLETPPENSSPLPDPLTPTQTQISPQENENSNENFCFQKKRNRESVNTDAGYTSGTSEDLPPSPESTRRSKRLKKSVVNELNEKSYKAIPFEAPIPEKSKSRSLFKLPCPISLLISKRPRKRKIDASARRDEKLKKHLMSEVEGKNKLLMYSPSKSLRNHCREEDEEIHRIFEENFKNFNVSQFYAVFGDNENLRGFSPRISGSILSAGKCFRRAKVSQFDAILADNNQDLRGFSLRGSTNVVSPEKYFQRAKVSQFDAVLADNNQDLRGFSFKCSTSILNPEKCSGDEVKEKNLTLVSEVIDDRLQELQETSCSYTPPISPEFPGDFELSDEDDVVAHLGVPANSRMSHQQKIEKRMKELQREFDVENDREEETAKWFDLMETLRVAERRSVFDIKEYEKRVVKSLGDVPGERLGFEELARREEPEDIARLFVASLQLANTRTVDITTSEDQSNVYLSLLKPIASQPSER